MKDEIKMVLRKQFQANIDKHAVNVRIMLNNPMAIHEHTDFMSAVELELAQIAEYVEYYDALGRVNDLKANGYINLPQFQKVKTFDVSSE